MKSYKISSLTLAKRRAISGYLFTLPFIIGLIFFFLTPLVRSIFFSFSNVSISNIGLVLEAVGFKNYNVALFVDPVFVKSITDSLKNMIFTFPSIIIYSFFIATILNQKFKGRTLARVMFFLPVIVTSGVIFYLQNDVIGVTASQAISGGGANSSVDALDLTGAILKNLSINSGFIYDFINSSINQIYYITVSSGVQILIFLAGLQTISPSIFEASSIEGASGWDNFWKITLPMISPLILVNAVYTIIDSLSGLSNQVINSIYRVTFTNSDFGLSAAMSWVYLLLIILILVVVTVILNKFIYYEND